MIPKTTNRVNFELFSKKSFSDEKNLNAWSLKGNRLNAKEWLDFREANKGSFYNLHLENTLKAMENLKSCFSIDKLEGVNFHGDNELLDFFSKNYAQIYDRLCMDNRKYILYHNYGNDSLKQIGAIRNLSPNFPFWNNIGENLTQSEINAFIKNDNLAPYFSKYDVYFNSHLSFTFKFDDENLAFLVREYDYRIKHSFTPKTKEMIAKELDVSDEDKIVLELENIFLSLCKGICADYAFMDLSYLFVGYDYVIDSKNGCSTNLNDFVYERSCKESLEEYTNNYFLNYYSNELLKMLDMRDLLENRTNRYIINYDFTPKNPSDESIQGIFSKQQEQKIDFVSFVEWEEYVYKNKDDFWDMDSADNQAKWNDFLAKRTTKELPKAFDCTLAEKLLYGNSEEFESMIKAHKIFNH